MVQPWHRRPLRVALRLGGLLLCFLVLGVGGCGSSLDPELERMQGQWVAVTVIEGKNVFPAEKVRESGMRLRITGDKLDMQWNGVSTGTVQVHTEMYPKGIDMIVNMPGAKTEYYAGIYELNGDTLKLCFRGTNAPRPAEFKTMQPEFGVIVILERQKS